MALPTIVSIQVGRPQRFKLEDVSDAADKSWTSAIVKRAVAGWVHVERTNIRGDEQADLKHHGGVDKAVLAYAAGHYSAWKHELPDLDLPFGAFGENLTVSGIDESSCCVGDVYGVGECRFEISQPRQPCWKLSRRWNCSDLSVIVQKTGRTGWYLRVLDTGTIESGMHVRLIDRPFPKITVEWANRVMYAQPRDVAQDLFLAECPALSVAWRETLRGRVAKSVGQ